MTDIQSNPMQKIFPLNFEPVMENAIMAKHEPPVE